MKKHIIGEKRLKVGETAVLYVTTCSDVNPSFKHSRRLLECVVVGKIKGFTRDEDDRYIIRCSEDLRTEHVKTGAYADEAIASKYSPFLMTWEEYENYKKESINSLEVKGYDSDEENGERISITFSPDMRN